MPTDESAPEVDPAVWIEGGRVTYEDEDLGPLRGGLYGIALDVGTTTEVLELVDLTSGAVAAAGVFENPQRFGGSDVIARILTTPITRANSVARYGAFSTMSYGGSIQH